MKEKLVQLTAGILGIHSLNGQRTAVIIPKGATLQVSAALLADTRMLDVIWEGHTLAVFAADLLQRSTEVKFFAA